MATGLHSCATLPHISEGFRVDGLLLNHLHLNVFWHCQVIDDNQDPSFYIEYYGTYKASTPTLLGKHT